MGGNEMNRIKKVLIPLAIVFEIIVFGVLIFLGCATIGVVKSIILALITIVISIVSMYFVSKWLKKK
jgi:hypothetical protein